MKTNEPLQLAEIPIPETKSIEDKILGNILTDITLMDSIIRIVKGEMFSQPQARYMWERILDMYYKHEEISIVTIMPRVDKNYVTECIIPNMTYISASAIVNVAVLFVNTYIKRQAYIKALTILQDIEDTSVGADEITAHFDTFSDNVYKGLEDNSCKSAVDIVVEMTDRLQQGKVNRVPTNIPTVDAMTYGGMGSGNLVILAARPSTGKSTIALQMAVQASLGGTPVQFFSLEMTAEELVQRVLLSTGLLTPYEFHSCPMDWNNYNQAVSLTITPNLFINDSARSLEEICHKIVLEVQAGRCKMAVIDYLALIVSESDRSSTEAIRLGKITARLKGLAKECKIPILLLCQLNRDSMREGRSPQLHDLRDSGAIEQDADIVMMLENPKESGQTMENTIDVWVRKNRGGKRNFDSPIRLKGNNYYSDFKEIINDGSNY